MGGIRRLVLWLGIGAILTSFLTEFGTAPLHPSEGRGCVKQVLSSVYTGAGSE